MIKRYLKSKLNIDKILQRLDEVEETQKNQLPKIEERLDNLEEQNEELLDLKDRLTEKVLEDKPQLRHTLLLIEENEYTKKEIVKQLKQKFDISTTTAYRRINTLEEELQYVEKTEKGYKPLVEVE